MKKTLLAAALAAAAAGASAQSNVTIYGRVDVGIAKFNDGTTNLGYSGRAAGDADTWQVRQGSPSRLGFRVTEDLGGGLRANAILEHRFNPDTGTQNNATAFWHGRSIVELASTQFGAVYLGRDYIPMFYIADQTDPFGGDTVAAVRDRFNLATFAVDGGQRTSNTVGYKTPSFSGLSAQVAVSAGEGTRGANPVNKRSVGANLVYASGPVYAGIGTEHLDGNFNAVNVGLAYDFGVVRPMLSYARRENGVVAGATQKDTGWSVGATAPLAGGRLKAVYARLDPQGNNNELTKYGIGYEYPLSKRTSVYTDFASADQKGTNGGPTRANGFDLGVKHNF
ncbi:porin [Aquabacterium sp. J223]|uniref:porin n=1 Tax=Aquabacterium sp. J223 TaxID=2898431 RepID=UPI0021ADE5D4|nr:porin [Aquabacterium sp. J223]UUX96199.1 porin [Aquabacterium sp. J223]